MDFSLTFLGMGDGLSPELGNNNVLVTGTDPEGGLLLDCGYTTPLRLLERGWLERVRHVVITHVHADHVGGLEPLMLLHRFRLERRLHLWLHEDLEAELWEGALRGGLERSQTREGVPLQLGLEAYFEVHRLPRDAARLELPGLPTVELMPTLHVVGKPAFSLVLDGRVYYSSDTQLLPPENGPGGQPLELCFQECSLHPAPVHTDLATLGAQVPAALRERTYLMHTDPGYAAIDVRSLGFAGWVEVGRPYRVVQK